MAKILAQSEESLQGKKTDIIEVEGILKTPQEFVDNLSLVTLNRPWFSLFQAIDCMMT